MQMDGPDLALLVVDAELPTVRLAAAPPRADARIRQWGFAGLTGKDEPPLKVGLVKDPSCFFGTLDCRPGDSGSGLFDDDDNLVAVTNARPNSEQEKGVYAVPHEKVRAFLRAKSAGFPRLVESLGVEK